MWIISVGNAWFRDFRRSSNCRISAVGIGLISPGLLISSFTKRNSTLFLNPLRQTVNSLDGIYEEGFIWLPLRLYLLSKIADTSVSCKALLKCAAGFKIVSQTLNLSILASKLGSLSLNTSSCNLLEIVKFFVELFAQFGRISLFNHLLFSPRRNQKSYP